MKLLVLYTILAAMLIIALIIYFFADPTEEYRPIIHHRDNIRDQSSGLRDRKITLHKGKFSAREVLDSIAKQADLHFNYRCDEIPDSITIHQRFKNISVQCVFVIIFKDTEISWVYYKNAIRLQKQEIVPLIANRKYMPLEVTPPILLYPWY